MKCKTLALFLLLAMGCATRKPSLTPAQEVGTNSSAQDNSFLLDLMQHYPGYFDTLLQQNNLWKIKIIYNERGTAPALAPLHASDHIRAIAHYFDISILLRVSRS